MLPFSPAGRRSWPGQLKLLIPRPFVLLLVVVEVPHVVSLPLGYVLDLVGPRSVRAPLLVVAAVGLSAVLV